MNSIYALVDPRTSELRYIGKSRQPEKRLQFHCSSKSDTHCSRWIQRLKSEGVLPRMVIIEKNLSEDQWPEREQFWIAHYRQLGAELTNITDGGHHVVRVKHYIPVTTIVIYKDWALALAMDKTLHGTEHKTLWYLIGSMDRSNAFIGTQAFIAKELDMPQPMVSAAIKKLVAANAISKTSQGGANGYRVNLDVASRGSLKA